MNNLLVKSFTILEALISMVLMSVIIALSYSVFNLIEKQMSLFKSENENVLQYNLFNTTLKNDIYKSTDFNSEKSQLSLKKYNGSTVNYTVFNDYILRQEDINIDTFRLDIINYEFLKMEASDSLNETFKVSIEMLGDSINANYYLKKNTANVINSLYFNEN